MRSSVRQSPSRMPGIDMYTKAEDRFRAHVLPSVQGHLRQHDRCRSCPLASLLSKPLCIHYKVLFVDLINISPNLIGQYFVNESKSSADLGGVGHQITARSHRLPNFPSLSLSFPFFLQYITYTFLFLHLAQLYNNVYRHQSTCPTGELILNPASHFGLLEFGRKGKQMLNSR
jgi:hypothetical protein